MSLKKCIETTRTDIEVRRTMCDMCGITVEKGAVNFRLVAVRNESHDYGPSSDTIVDICSTDCLAANLSGLTLLLHSKVIPGVPDLSIRKDEPYGSIRLEKCETEKKASLVTSLREAFSSIRIR